MHESLNLVFLGAPGAGKGTQADRICQQFGLQHISTGDLFRENLGNNTELGQLARTYMDAGKLVPDDVTVAMVKDRLARPDVEAGFILDGFPRTLAQAEALEGLMAELGRSLKAVLYFKVPRQELIDRLSGRLICRDCKLSFHKIYNQFDTCPYDRCEGEHLYQRDDDQPDVVGARLDTYNNETSPLIDYYSAKGILAEIDGMQEIDTVTASAVNAIEG